MIMKNGLIIGSNGDRFWYLNDQLHRDDGPAVEYMHNAYKAWYQESKDAFHKKWCGCSLWNGKELVFNK